MKLRVAIHLGGVWVTGFMSSINPGVISLYLEAYGTGYLRLTIKATNTL